MVGKQQAEPHPMPMKDRFDSDHPLPLFLSGDAVEYEQRGTSRILKASLVVVAAMVGGIAITLSLGNPAKLFADATASLADSLGVSRGVNPTSATSWAADAQSIQSSADAQAAAPAPLSVMAHDNVAAGPEPTDQAQTENSQPASGALLGQFQAWAVKEDAQAQEDAQPQQPVQPQEAAQPAPAPQVAEDDPAPEQASQKPRRARSLQNARAEIRHVQKSRARVQRRQIAREQAPPVQASVQQQSAQQQPLQQQPVQLQPMQQDPMQQAQPPSFLQSLGLSH
jgi:hypothetical protein